MNFATKVIHGGVSADPHSGAVNIPVYQTSTYKQQAPGIHKGYEYSRLENPTREALESNLASIENGRFAFCFSSGMAAIDAVMKLLKAGDEVIATHDIYGGAYRLFTQVYEKMGIRFRFVSMRNVNDIKPLLNGRTKLIWLETPSNPLLQITDIKAVADLVKNKNIMVAADNTFASPYLQNPLDLGVDIVMHSITKYLGGHSDVIMGGLVTKNEKIAEQLSFIQKSVGAVCGPQDCYLILRGIKTLHLRMQRHCENAKEIAHFLKSQPKVDQVYWPGFASHVNHEVAKRQMKDFGGMVSFSLKGNLKEDSFQLLSNLKVFSLAESLGGVESLASHPVSMSHASVPKKERETLGIVDSLVRLSVGVEDINDLKEDIEQALESVGKKGNL